MIRPLRLSLLIFAKRSDCVIEGFPWFGVSPRFANVNKVGSMPDRQLPAPPGLAARVL